MPPDALTKLSEEEKYFRDFKLGAIYEGTSHMQLATIAEMALHQ